MTFLFTDIEGSTRLFRRLGDDYAGLLDEHNRALRTAIEARNGFVVKTEGDGFFAAFENGRDGVLAAVAGQEACSPSRHRMARRYACVWGCTRARVSHRDNDYVALAVH